MYVTRRNAASHHLEHAEYNRRRHPYWRHIGRHLCTSLCASVITCRHMICLQINVLTHDAQGEMVLAERLELPTARLQIGCSTN